MVFRKFLPSDPRAMLLALPAMLAAGPAWANGGSTPLPEPNSMVLLSLGITGLVIGRRIAAKRDKD